MTGSDVGRPDGVRRWARVLVALAVGLTAAGCIPSSPSPSAWTQKATQSLEDSAGALASAHLVLREEERGHLLGRSGVVMLVDAEEATGKTSEAFSALQPPENLARLNDKVAQALAAAADLAGETRQARVAGDAESYRELSRRLLEERDRLNRLAGELK